MDETSLKAEPDEQEKTPLQAEPDEQETTSLKSELGEKKESLTIDDIVDRIVPSGLNTRLILLFLATTWSIWNTASNIYIVVFTGFIPYIEWECVSERCWEVLDQANSSISKEVMCDNKLIAGQEFNWTTDRTSFAIDWGFYCDEEVKLPVITSFFFVGACLGMLCSTAIFDRVGRKYGALIGIFLGTLGTVIGIFTNGYYLMLVLRVIQGFGQFVGWTGVYCLIIEFAPTHLRNPVSASALIMWSFGYIVIVCLSYTITSWRLIFLAAAILNVVTAIPLIFLPKSPRFLLVQGKEEEAKEVLTSFSRAAGNPINLEEVDIVYKKRVLTFLEQVKDFNEYRTMAKQTFLLTISWFIIAVIFYGYAFGWGKISDDLYASYLLGACGKFIAFSSTIPVCKWLGPKRAILFFLAISIVSNFIAMPDLMFGEKWSLEYVACLIGSMGASATFGVIYLFTSELAPTSHRGMVLSLNSSSARIGSFIGPYMSLMYNVADRRVPLVVFAVLMALCGLAVWFQPDTTGRRIPETPKDVEMYAGKKRYEEIEDGTKA